MGHCLLAKQGPEAIFEARWGMIMDHRLLNRNDATEPGDKMLLSDLKKHEEHYPIIGDSAVMPSSEPRWTEDLLAANS